jgi:hypothetical protein
MTNVYVLQAVCKVQISGLTIMSSMTVDRCLGWFTDLPAEKDDCSNLVATQESALAMRVSVCCAFSRNVQRHVCYLFCNVHS